MSDEREAQPALNLAVVGLGYWGPNLLRVLAEHNDADIRWVCDLDRRRLERVSHQFGASDATTELDRVLADPLVDGVLIATPVHTHYDLARRCLEAGKHVFVEKPLAPSVAEAQALIARSEELGRVLMCGHTFLYSPAVRAVAEMIRSGELGEIFFISSQRVNLGIHQRDVSVIWDLGPHDFSILLYWLGTTPRWIRALGRASIVPTVADVAFVTLGFPNEVIVNIELSWLAPSKLRRTVIVASRKMVVYEDGGPQPIKVYDSGAGYRDPQSFGEWHLADRTGDILVPKLSSDEPLFLQIGDFLRAVRLGALPAGSEALALDVVRLSEAAERSLANDGERMTIPALPSWDPALERVSGA